MTTKTLQHVEISLSDGSKIAVVHNFKDLHGPVNSLMAAFESWKLRTDELTAESFASYVINKGTHEVYSVEQYEKLTGIKLPELSDTH